MTSVCYQFSDRGRYTIHMGGVVDASVSGNFIVLNIMLTNVQKTQVLEYESKEYAQADIELFYEEWNKYSIKTTEIPDRSIGYQSAIGEMVSIEDYEDQFEDDRAIGFGGVK